MTSDSNPARVTCSACRALCCRQEVLLIGDAGVPDAFVERDAWGGARMARDADGWCRALDPATMLCRIYAVRPWICRELEMSGPECLAVRAAAGSD